MSISKKEMKDPFHEFLAVTFRGNLKNEMLTGGRFTVEMNEGVNRFKINGD